MFGARHNSFLFTESGAARRRESVLQNTTNGITLKRSRTAPARRDPLPAIIRFIEFRASENVLANQAKTPKTASGARRDGTGFARLTKVASRKAPVQCSPPPSIPC